MNKPFYKGRLSINKEKSSPYWMVTFQGPDGKMRRRSTKVPVNGGEFEGDRITAKLAERIAYQRGVQIAWRGGGRIPGAQQCFCAFLV